MIGRIVIYGLLLAGLALLMTDPMMMIIGGPLSLSVPGGGFSATDPSAAYLIPIVLLVWVVLRQRKRHSADRENED